MQMIVDLLGYPTKEELEIFSDIQDKDLLNSIPENYQSGTFDEKFKDYSPEAIDLLR